MDDKKTETKNIFIVVVPRTCNRHTDCDAADKENYKYKGKIADHCYDECCEECFGY